MQIPIFLSSDNNYAPFVATTMASICENTKSFCEFYILDGGISKENQEKISQLKKYYNNFSIEYIQVDIEKYFKNLTETKYISKSMYSRFLIPVLKPELNRAIYSDVDVIALGDIKKMYDENLEDYSLGAVWHELYDNTPKAEEIKDRLEVKSEHKLFCSGNLIIDCKKWRENDIPNKLIEMGQNMKFKTETPDQDLLNQFFECNYKVLHQKYGFVNQAFDYYKNSDDIIIRHYIGQIKPWHLNENAQTTLYHNLQEFWYYARKTAFYEELNAKTQNETEQKAYLRQLQYWKLMTKKAI